MSRYVIVSVSLCFVLAACSEAKNRTVSPSAGLTSEVQPLNEGAWYRPNAATTWQWQLTGTPNTSYDVEAYDIDLFDSSSETISALHNAGRRVICYFSAGSGENWRADYGGFLSSDLGCSLNGWKGERWLDIRSGSVWQLMLQRLDLAASKGCDGVEPDNVDGYANKTGFALSADDQLAFNRNLTNEAHKRGLAIGLKNDGDQVTDLVAYYDFALNEQCYAYDECNLYAAFPKADKPLFNAEYTVDLTAAQKLATTFCTRALAANQRTLILPLVLDDSFRLSCDTFTAAR